MGMSQRAACQALGLSRSVLNYQSKPSQDDAIVAVLQELAERFPERGFGKYFKILRRRGHGWNHKRVHRVYCTLKLNRRRVGKKRLPPRTPAPLAAAARINQSLSIDFMSDALWCGRRFRTFNAVDDCNREALAIEIDLNLPTARVIRVLERIAAWRGYPDKIRMDNGPEFIAGALADWAQTHGIELEFIKPGRPMQNGFVERFNRSYRAVRTYQRGDHDQSLVCGMVERIRGCQDDDGAAGPAHAPLPYRGDGQRVVPLPPQQHGGEIPHQGAGGQAQNRQGDNH